MSQRILVTAALPYANGPVHLGHLLEHTQQVDKTVRALGLVETDAQAYVRQISIIRARHERRSPEVLRGRLDATIAAVADAARG